MKKQFQFSLVAACVFLLLTSCSNNKEDIKLFPIKSGDKWGYIDKAGKYIINSQFDDAFNFSDGLALIESGEGKFGFIGEDGKYVINPVYKSANKFSEGLACVVMENGKPQFISKEGKILFTVDKADVCYGFQEGMALIKVKGKYGFIDKTGKIIVNPIYDDANYYSEGLASVAKIDEKTKELKWGFIDKSGSVKINFQFVADKEKYLCQPDYFKEGLAFVSSDGKKWGCISTDGKYQVNPQFEGSDFSRFGFKNGLSLVSQGGSYGYIDKNGKYVINPQFKDANSFSSNGLAAVQHSDGKWGFINKEGKYEINPQFDDVASCFLSGIAFVKSSDKYGIIDTKGLYVINPLFDDVKLYDINTNYSVKSDYVDNDEIAGQIFHDANDNSFLGYSSHSTLGDIINQYPQTTINDLETNYLIITNPKISVNEILKIGSLRFGFKDDTYTQTPIYKSVQQYNYYYGSYYTQVFDRWDKRIQQSAKLSYLTLDMKLQSSSKGKGRTLAEALKKQAIKFMNVTPLDSTDIDNNDLRGMYLLKNNNSLIYISYQQKDKDNHDESVSSIVDTTTASYRKRNVSSIEPYIILFVVNSNYGNSFEEIAKVLRTSFKKEDI
jgi:hypothetical protein